MLEIKELHDEVFSLLEEYRENVDSNLKFTLRKSNRGNRLEEKYWFYGNDDYLAVSFWSGMDWKNKTPNIFFAISKTGRTYLEISVQDSEVKKEFVNTYLKKPLNLEGDGPKYYKEYNKAGEFNYMGSLETFLGEDKFLIDTILHKKGDKLFGDAEHDDLIDFIDEDVFKEQLKFVKKYREVDTLKEIEAPIKIKNLVIKGFGPIRDLRIFDIPFETQFIFLTGLNGTGKSSILKGLAPALSQKEILDDEILPKSDYEVDLSLFDQYGQIHSYYRKNNQSVSNKLKPICLSFAAYGPVRLQTANTDLSKYQLTRAFSKTNILDSIRESDSYLLDINVHIKHWSQQPKHKKHLSKRKSYIEEVLRDFFESKFRVNIGDEGVTYTEFDSENNDIGSVQYHKLSTGLRSTLSLLGDLMIRMYEQTPDIIDPAEFKGIVLIDEIDIHLHPKLQKRFVEELAKTFPKLQFIITTHSPIPLLGAPINSKYYKVERNIEEGVIAIDLNEIEVSTLLPNAILTSDLFDMNSLFSTLEGGAKKEVRLEDYYKEIEFNDNIKDQLRVIASQLRNKN